MTHITTYQKILTGILLLLTGVLLGVILMISRGLWIPPERVQVRYTDIFRNTDPVDHAVNDQIYSSVRHFNDIAEQVIPAVVYIETEMTVHQQLPDDHNHQFENQFWDRFLPRQRAQSIGSGVVITSDGYILTNHHVIDGARDRITVHTHDKKQFHARLIGSDPSTDLAVIKIEKPNAAPVIIGNSDQVKIGDWVLAVGNPFRLRSTVTAGIISAVGRDVDIINDRMRIESFIQTDAAINRGNSGGALVNARGELIGINTAIASESGSYQGYGFAVPVNMAVKIGQDLIEFGEVRRAFLGVEIVSIDYDQAKKSGLETISGVLVRNLVPDGSADLGGMKKGDIILAVNGFPVGAANRLQERIALMRPGEEVTLSVWRNKRAINLQFPVMGFDNDAIRTWAVAEPLPPEILEFDDEPDTAVPQKSFDAGFVIAELPVSNDFSKKELVVIRISPGTPASHSGMIAEDVVTHVNNQPVSRLDDFSSTWDKIPSQQPVQIRIIRGDRPITLEITP